MNPDPVVAGLRPEAGDTNPDAGLILADHVLAARAGSLPEASRKRTVELILDAVGAAVAAHEAPGLPAIRDVITSWGGRPDATVIGTPVRVPAHHAALVNSALTRAMELDDVHEKALVHATATTVPVALAVAEQSGGISGRRFVDAVTLGNDIACRLAIALDMPLGERIGGRGSCR